MAAGREWWERFFSGPWLRYQLAMDEPALVRPAVDFLEAVNDLRPPLAVLDAPCGDGRLGREFARRGYRVTGLDASPALLAAGRRKARAERLALDWVAGDMRRVRWRGRFDLALCWWGSFGYFDEAGNRRQLAALAGALKPGGVLAMDLHSPETIFPSFARQQWSERGGVTLVNQTQYDALAGRVETDWTFIDAAGGRRRRAHSSIRLYTLRELVGMAEAVGLGDCRAFGDYEGAPFELDARRLVFLAVKGRR